MKYFFFISWCLIHLLPLAGQERGYVFQHINSKDGLQSNRAKAILQDTKGFYWIATDGGLQRFDGRYFTGVVPERIPYSCQQATENQILQDKEGNIWWKCEGSISIYYPFTGVMESININDDTLTSNKSDIGSFCQDKSGDIWIVTKFNLYKYDFSIHKALKWLVLFKEIDNKATNKVLYDNIKDLLWVAGGRNIISVDTKKKKILSPFPDTLQPFFSKFAAYPLAFEMDHNQNLWFSDWVGRIYKFNTVNFNKKVYTAHEEAIPSNASTPTIAYSFGEDANHDIWIGTDNGLFYYNSDNDNLEHINENGWFPSASIENAIHDFYLDKEGNLLICTNDGICILPSTINHFTTVYEKSENILFPKSAVYQIFETSYGDILVSSWGKGWFLFDKYFKLKKQVFNANPPSEWSNYRKNIVWCFAEDLRGKIWIGYQYGLIGLYDIVTHEIEYREVQEFDCSTIRIMRRDTQGNIWFGLNSGNLGKWDAVKDSFQLYSNFKHLSNQSSSIITDLIINHKGELWVATYGNGFFRFDPIKESISEQHFILKKDSTNALINSFTELSDSIIGLSTYPTGVVLYNTNNNSYSSLPLKLDMPIAVAGLAKDKNDNLWIATSEELLKVNSMTKSIISYNQEDGIYIKEFDFNITTLHDGRMVVPGSTGLVYFSPDNIKPLPEPPSPVIANFKIYSTSLLIDSILALKCIELSHKQNFITINYASLSFLGRNTTQYFYQLENVNKEWVSAGTERFANYTNLRPGRYTFRVKCENRDGIQSQNVTKLIIHIHFPWWLSWWAYSLYGLAAFSLIYISYKYRIHQLEAKQELKVKTILITQGEERRRIATDLHDTVGSTLSSISIYSSAVEHMKSNQFHEIQLTVSLIGQSARMVMENMSDIIWAISPANDSFQNMIDRLQLLSTQLLKAKKIQLKFDIAEDLHSIKLSMPQRKNIYLILREAIHNVAKHSQATHCIVSAKLENKIIDLEVSDNGNGFSVTMGGLGGNGIINMKARSEELKALFHVQSEINKGTHIYLKIAYS
jgi:signal transduction histidine kinase/ligand-binding sensor domain-containing protein